MKNVLCFTCSFNRPKMLRECILGIKNQSYPIITHGVNITYKKELDIDGYFYLFEDLEDPRTIISYNENNHQHINHLLALKSVPNFMDFDIFVKIDDDDIYKKDYVKTIVQAFEDEDVDIVSSRQRVQLNGTKIRHMNQHNLGANPDKYDFAMPMTFAFNRKALALILPLHELYHYEDKIWRDVWAKNHLKHREIDNTRNTVWHIHGNNVSTSSFLK